MRLSAGPGEQMRIERFVKMNDGSCKEYRLAENRQANWLGCGERERKTAMNSGKTRNAFRAASVLIVIMLFGGLLVSSPQAAQPWKVASVNLIGADGANNNMAFAYDRYVLVAPY